MSLTVAPGVTVTTVSGPPGASGGPLGGGSAFGFQQLAIPPGAPAAFTFATVTSYPANAGADLRVSSDCQTYAAVHASGPAPPCDCRSLAVRPIRTAAAFSDARRFKFQLVWTMTCGGGTGNCQGEVSILPPRGVALTSPLSSNITCTGTCASTSSGTIEVAGTFARTMQTRKRRRNKTVVFAFKTFCMQGGGRIAASSSAITLVYNAKGFLDRRKSDLNADGLPDGPRRK